MIYYYPENLNAKPVIWLWWLNDLAKIGVFGIISVFMLTAYNLTLPLVVTALYSFLSMQFAGDSLKYYLIKTWRFLIWGQQIFKWKKEAESIKQTRGKGRKH
ncbi:MAG: hypothetical protein LBU94_04630 [Clostridiales bacterium]|jgi:hypothetical protein|nr:hypothetical protein [Clostridiales bacterium]